jgi:hypothetical protein
VARRASTAASDARHDVERDGAGFGRRARMLGGVGETLAIDEMTGRRPRSSSATMRHRGAPVGWREHLAGVALVMTATTPACPASHDATCSAGSSIR